jgi:hypothetical protein
MRRLPRPEPENLVLESFPPDAPELPRPGGIGPRPEEGCCSGRLSRVQVCTTCYHRMAECTCPKRRWS